MIRPLAPSIFINYDEKIEERLRGVSMGFVGVGGT
jgi:hypothetical protein